MRIVLARARRELPTGTTLERAREAPAGRTQATEVERKSAAVVFAGLDRGRPIVAIRAPTFVSFYTPMWLDLFLQSIVAVLLRLSRCWFGPCQGRCSHCGRTKRGPGGTVLKTKIVIPAV